MEKKLSPASQSIVGRLLIIGLIFGFAFVGALSSEGSEPPSSDLKETAQLLSKAITNIKKEQEKIDEIDKELEQIQNLIRMFDEIKLIIEENAAYIKDWRNNYNCIVGKNVASLVEQDIERFKQLKNTILQRKKSVDTSVYQEISKLYQKKIVSLDEQIAASKKMIKEYSNKCLGELKSRERDTK